MTAPDRLPPLTRFGAVVAATFAAITIGVYLVVRFLSRIHGGPG